MAAIADLNTLYASAIAADEAGDYATAARHARAILARLATTPDIARGGRGDGQELSFPSADAIKAFLSEVKGKLKAASVASGGPFAQSKVTYARPTAG